MTTYEIPGERVKSLESFWSVIGEVVNGPGGCFGNNLDAFADCLSGGFGTPDDGFSFRRLRHAVSAQQLGYAETVRQLERRLASSHPSNRATIETQLVRAQRKEGPTVFDWITEVIRHRGILLELT
jgi:RNAse (barnase) inhibitor barstar